MNPSLIKKIINKKVTINDVKDLLPVLKRSSPISINGYFDPELSLKYI
jgi:hypothetical protein